MKGLIIISDEPIAKILKREEFVIPTKVGHIVKHQRYPVFSICCKNFWIPVCTGMTTFAIGSTIYNICGNAFICIVDLLEKQNVRYNGND